jgi:galactokinase
MASIGEAPGRLDFMGGVADYSGSLVLQVATAATTRVAASLVEPGGGAAILVSASFGEELRLPLAPLAALVSSGAGLSAASLRSVRGALEAASAPRWAFYVFGSLAAFALETGWLPPGGGSLRLEVSSTVPLAQGVSSSASVEVATLRAVGAASGAPLPPLRAAHVAQAAENHVVGAPCGLMDQLASSLGSPRRVLPILCRPDGVEPLAALPAGAAVVGWPSGVEHSVAGSPYGAARAAAFMAKRVLEARGAVGAPLACLTQLSPSDLEAVAGELPEAISGADFAAQFGAPDDALSVVDAGAVYGLRAAARFPVGENFRCVGRLPPRAVVTPAP